MKKVINFGCRLNTYESTVIENILPDEADVIVFNTCGVTLEAEKQARQSIRKYRRQYPQSKIIVTGCAAQNNPQQFIDMPEVDQILGNHDKMQMQNYLAEIPRIKITDIMQIKETALHMLDDFNKKPRAFLQVQNGCNYNCTFCNIPLGRGKARSIGIGEIVHQAKLLVQNGCKEIVLTGVDLTSYGVDLPGNPTLGQMVKRLLALVKDLPRLRLSSLDPAAIDDDLWDLLADEPRFLPNWHLSLQAGDSMILKRMKRRHTPDDIIAVCQKARNLRSDITIGADIIAGFPTESPEYFSNTYNLIRDLGIEFLHVFPYSPRPNTPAAKMPQLDSNTIKERAKLLRELGNHNQEKLFKKILDSKDEVLFESSADGLSIGKLRNYAPIKIQGDFAAGMICNVKVTTYNQDELYGMVL